LDLKRERERARKRERGERRNEEPSSLTYLGKAALAALTAQLTSRALLAGTLANSCRNSDKRERTKRGRRRDELEMS
jgi:hypothetical protein